MATHDDDKQEPEPDPSPQTPSDQAQPRQSVVEGSVSSTYSVPSDRVEKAPPTDPNIVEVIELLDTSPTTDGTKVRLRVRYADGATGTVTMSEDEATCAVVRYIPARAVIS